MTRLLRALATPPLLFLGIVALWLTPDDQRQAFAAPQDREKPK